MSMNQIKRPSIYSKYSWCQTPRNCMTSGWQCRYDKAYLCSYRQNGLHDYPFTTSAIIASHIAIIVPAIATIVILVPCLILLLGWGWCVRSPVQSRRFCPGCLLRRSVPWSAISSCPPLKLTCVVVPIAPLTFPDCRSTRTSCTGRCVIARLRSLCPAGDGWGSAEYMANHAVALRCQCLPLVHDACHHLAQSRQRGARIILIGIEVELELDIRFARPTGLSLRIS